MINDFVKKFTEKPIDNILQIRNQFFLASGELLKLKNQISQEPFAIGTFLGETRNGRFFPSTALIDLLSKESEQKVFVNKKTEWLFLCARDVFGKSIVRSGVEQRYRGLVFVQNELDENLGYGEVVADIQPSSKMVVKNVLDKGSFLRREI